MSNPVLPELCMACGKEPLAPTEGTLPLCKACAEAATKAARGVSYAKKPENAD